MLIKSCCRASGDGLGLCEEGHHAFSFVYHLTIQELAMFIVKHITTGDVIARTSSFDVAIQALRSFLDKYTKIGDHEVEIARYN